MIGKGAKYLKAAGFGRYRITAASLGRDWMIKPWLTIAAQQAIRGAFGVDGTAVIAATNEYLNDIAASDKAKATALASLINEDPMMVCSLGLEPQGVTMPVRYLKGDDRAYVEFTISPMDLTGNKEIIIDSIAQHQTSDNTVFAIYDSTNAVCLRVGYGWQDTQQSGGSDFFNVMYGRSTFLRYWLPRNVDYDVRFTQTKYYVNGSEIVPTTSSASEYVNMSQTGMGVKVLLMNRENHNAPSNSTWVSITLKDKFFFVPAIRNGVVGIANGYGGDWHANANNQGSFEIYYTRNGQPWTPPTP